MSISNRKEPRFALIIVLSLLVCAAAITFLGNELVQNQTTYTISFAKEQSLLVEQLAKQSKDMLTEKTGTEQNVIEKIIKKAETSGSRYWFLFKGNQILFLKDDFEMEELKLRTVDTLLDSFKTAGGYNVDALSLLKDSNKNGYVLFSPSKSEEKILVSIASFNVNNADYSIGMCTTESYILSGSKLVKHNTYLFIVVVFVCMILFSSIIVFILIINKKEEEIIINEKIIHSKNLKIQDLIETSSKSDLIYNEKTKLYGKDVLFTLLKKANRPDLFPFSILVIHLDYSKNIEYDGLVLELVSDIQKILPKSSVATRASQNQLAILFMKTEYGKVKDFQEKLLKAWSGKLSKLQVSVQTDVVTQFIGQDAPIEVFELWNKINERKTTA